MAGLSLTVRADSKVFRNGEFLFGFTSSFRMGQLLRYSLTPPRLKEGQDIGNFMVTNFIDAVRNCLKGGGFAVSDKEAERGGNFLVGFRGRLYQIGSDYQVGEALDGYDAVGCGQDVCLGSLYSSVGQEPAMRLTMALSAAERHSAGVRGPFPIDSI